MTKNKHKVRENVWRFWNERARTLFNMMVANDVLEAYAITKLAGSPAEQRECFEILKWNHAFMAACMSMGYEVEISLNVIKNE